MFMGVGCSHQDLSFHCRYRLRLFQILFLHQCFHLELFLHQEEFLLHQWLQNNRNRTQDCR